MGISVHLLRLDIADVLEWAWICIDARHDWLLLGHVTLKPEGTVA